MSAPVLEVSLETYIAALEFRLVDYFTAIIFNVTYPDICTSLAEACLMILHDEFSLR